MNNTSAQVDKWTDYETSNRRDKGPIQALFDTNVASLAGKTEGHLNNVSRLTDFITGSSFENMVLIPGRPGLIQLVHHGFASNTREGHSFAIAHGNLGDCTVFKTLPRETMSHPLPETQRMGKNGHAKLQTSRACLR